MRVLVVEDEVLIRMFVRDLLAEMGFECAEAADASEALALLEGDSGWRPDILVTDYNLGPGANGAVLAAEAMRRLPSLGVVYATGSPDRFANRLLGPRERLVPKPFAAVELLRAVHGVAPCAVASEPVFGGGASLPLSHAVAA